MTQIVTITSDWNKHDYYTGSIKAVLLSRSSNLEIVDISNSIASFNYIQAAFILKNVYSFFPPDTIHLVAVSSELGEGEHFSVVQYEGQLFIGNDNGFFGLVFNKKPEKVVRLNTGTKFKNSTFPELSVFCDIVSFILKQGNLTEIGELADDVVRKSEMLPQIEMNTITGKIVYIDSYGNGITNISSELFAKEVQGNKFEISIENVQRKINKINDSYKDVDRSSLVCVFNSLGLLEIAIREGNASELMNITTNLHVRIKY